jgi:hypothetical protein
MARWSRILVPLAIGVGCLLLLFAVFIGQRTGHITDEITEREIRGELPLGTSLSTVEESLGSRRVEYSFEPSSKTVYAIVGQLKGSTIVASKSLRSSFILTIL